ncbi:hypothetical protein JJQ72_06380 [Paenibacillus sp. F411]|uniref:hypothetical protein n=1 Tax=Paenibacillus TaxID=44249 RepID=UPI0010FE4FC8|nr:MULTISPECIES: hypothetical protein [Paenibacillus]MBO2943604.1 hypothetical protein [Paenibacillus sp. F411]
MAKEIKIIQVAFNILDPDQLQLYDHVQERPNKSGYLKRLIQRDVDSALPQQQPAAAIRETDDFAVEGFI